MRVIYGNPKTIMTMGMTMLGDVPTPFFGFVDRSKVNEESPLEVCTDAAFVINKIDKEGGVIVYLENPYAAQRLHEMLHVLFSNASGGPWDDLEETEAGLQ